MSKRISKILSLLLVAVMCVSLLPAAAFAESADKVTYVAIGDSMSQGYMFLNYDEDSKGHNCGFGSALAGTYIPEFANLLKEDVGEENFEYIDLSVQGLQPDAICSFFEEGNAAHTEKTAQAFRWWTDGDPFSSMDALSAAYVDALTRADVITYDIGINYFGTYLTSRLTDGLGKDEKFTDLLTGKYAIYAPFIELLRESLIDSITENSSEKAAQIVDTALYAYTAYIVYTERALEYIYSANPDVKIIFIPLSNPHQDLEIDLGVEEGAEEGTESTVIDFSGLLDLTMDSLNTFMRYNSTYSSKIIYAPLASRVTSFADESYVYGNTSADFDVNLRQMFNELTSNAYAAVMDYPLYMIDQNGMGASYVDKETTMFGAVKAAFAKAIAEYRTFSLEDIQSAVGALASGDMSALAESFTRPITDEITKAAVGEEYAAENSLLKAVSSDYVLLHLALRFGGSARGFGAHPCPRGLAVKGAAVQSVYNSTVRSELEGVRYTLTVSYVKADGSEAAPEYVEKVAAGQNYFFASPEVGGYAADKAIVSGTMGNNDVNIVVTYTSLESDGCVTTAAVSELTEGTLRMSLGGTDMGSFTFAKSGSGWTIADESGYLSVSGTSLAHSNTPYVWTFSNNLFSTSVRSSSILGWVFSRTTKYYLANSYGTIRLSSSSSNATASFNTLSSNGKHVVTTPVKENVVDATCKTAGSYDEVYYCDTCGTEICRSHYVVPVTDVHTPADAVKENVVNATCKTAGSYDEVIYCSICGKELSRENKVISTLEHKAGTAKIERIEGVDYKVTRCTLCNDIIEKVPVESGEITADVTVTSATSRVLFIFSRTTYTAKITTSCTIPDVTVAKVEYSTNNRSWTTGTSCSSSSNISTLYVRVTDSTGAVTTFVYSNGNTSRT